MFLAAALAAGGYASCSAPFDPPALVNSLRVLQVQVNAVAPTNDADGDGVADADVDGDGDIDDDDFTTQLSGAYALPGETVNFSMVYADGRDQTEVETSGPPLITWIGGCWNPPGNDYYGCYAQLGSLFEGLQTGALPPEVGFGPEFNLTVPTDVLAAVGQPDAGPRVAIGFIFFIVCAGDLRPVQQEGDTAAGSFPIGCFDSSGRELGPDGFVPGYTQVYVFEDGRRNANPVINGILVDGEAPAAQVTVPACKVSEDERRKTGCSATDEFAECETVDIDVSVPDDVAEIDAGATGAEGEELREVVWVSYYADAGDFDSPTKLVSDAQKGIQGDHGTVWVPPETPGTYSVWAIVRDNRGGSSLVEQFINVTE
ncbi:MAG: hypothetical protein HOV80_37120 [Polyangiaceae bacterium]|nr:hypothetical protein [Polyangiaceae bacterium]